MEVNEIGKITKITGAKVLTRVTMPTTINQIGLESFITSYISIGSLVGTRLVDGRMLVMMVEEIYDNDIDIFVSSSISGIYDEVTEKFTFGTNTYPLVSEKVYKLWNKILEHIFDSSEWPSHSTIGTYVYDSSIAVGYNPNVLFGKHLGVFGNTGSGKTCTVVSIIQNYIRKNRQKNIKFIILDVNGEYHRAFEEDEAEYIPFESLRFHHSILNNPEYGRLFRAAEGVQYPALKECIEDLKKGKLKWDLEKLPEQIKQWVDLHTDIQNGKKNDYSKNQISGFLRTMSWRIDSIVGDTDLMHVINSSEGTQTIDAILQTNKKVVILDLQVSSDSLDIVVYLLFKAIYEYKSNNRDTTHLCLVLEEAHRYINYNTDDSRLGSYYIDKLSREGRKFGVGLIIASQIPSMLAYEVISQCNSVIMHKITSKRDMDFLRGVLRVSNDTFYLQMSALEKQHAIVCGEAFPNDSIVRIYDASPLPRSNDPEILDSIHSSIELSIDSKEKPSHAELEKQVIISNSEIVVSDELKEINELIDKLGKSASFKTTHCLVSKLKLNNKWTADQIDALCRAAVENSQVRWILGDKEIFGFYKELIEGVTDKTGYVLSVYDRLLKQEEIKEDD